MAKLIAGNWKMNGDLASSVRISKALAVKANEVDLNTDIAIFPPGPLIPEVLDAVSGSPIWVGGQDCHWNKNGAHTGDTSPHLLAELGCNCVIVGHSERRDAYAETNQQVKAKAEAALGSGLQVIICVGETEAERNSGETETVVGTQIARSLPVGGSIDSVIVAYEPVWAIGTGLTPTLKEIAAIHGFIRAHASESGLGSALRILYGGSVKPSNAAEILGIQGVDGALVGGASLKEDDFWGIIESCP
ncbi:MAG: triose-phosphate isomerase [Rhodospirillaceae bacterium]